MSKTIVYYCDICKRQSKEQFNVYSLPVLVHVFDECGLERHMRIEVRKLDVCPNCLSNAAAIETNAGMMGPAPGNGEYRMREPGVEMPS